MNSADGICVASLAPFLPGLLTLSSMTLLRARRRFSDFPLLVSPLRKGEKDGSARAGKKCGRNTQQKQDGLILTRSSHVIVRIVRELKDVGWVLGRLWLRRVPILMSIVGQSSVRIGCDVFVRIDCDESGGANGDVNRVFEETVS